MQNSEPYFQLFRISNENNERRDPEQNVPPSKFSHQTATSLAQRARECRQISLSAPDALDCESVELREGIVLCLAVRAAVETHSAHQTLTLRTPTLLTLLALLPVRPVGAQARQTLL